MSASLVNASILLRSLLTSLIKPSLACVFSSLSLASWARALCDWAYVGCLGVSGDGCSFAGLPVAFCEHFPFYVLFLFLVTNLWRAWHLSTPYTKNVNLLNVRGGRWWLCAYFSYRRFNNSNFLIFPWETGSISERTDGYKHCGLQIVLFGENSLGPQPEPEGSWIHAE